MTKLVFTRDVRQRSYAQYRVVTAQQVPAVYRDGLVSLHRNARTGDTRWIHGGRRWSPTAFTLFHATAYYMDRRREFWQCQRALIGRGTR